MVNPFLYGAASPTALVPQFISPGIFGALAQQGAGLPDPRFVLAQQPVSPAQAMATPLPSPVAPPPAISPPQAQRPRQQTRPGAIGQAMMGPAALPAPSEAAQATFASAGPAPALSPRMTPNALGGLPDRNGERRLTPQLVPMERSAAADATFDTPQAPGPLTQEMAQRNPRTRMQQLGLDIQDAAGRMEKTFTPDRLDAMALFANIYDAGRAKWLGPWDDGRPAGMGAVGDALQTFNDRREGRDMLAEERKLRQAQEQRAQAAADQQAAAAGRDEARFGWETTEQERIAQQNASLDAWIASQPEDQQDALRADRQVAQELMVRQLVPPEFQPDGTGRFVRFNRQTGAPEYFTNTDGSVFEAPLSMRERLDNQYRNRTAGTGLSTQAFGLGQTIRDQFLQENGPDIQALRVASPALAVHSRIQSGGAGMNAQERGMIAQAAARLAAGGVVSEGELRGIMGRSFGADINSAIGYLMSGSNIPDNVANGLLNIIVTNAQGAQGRVELGLNEATARAQGMNVSPWSTDPYALYGVPRGGQSGPRDFSGMSAAELRAIDPDTLSGPDLAALDAAITAAARPAPPQNPVRAPTTTATSPAPQEGDRAVNPQTGETMVYRRGQWVTQTNSLNNPLAEWAD